MLFVRSSVKPEGVGLTQVIDENIESDAVQNDILEYKNQESKMFEDLVEQKSQEADQIYSAEHNDTPSLQLKKRIEKLVEMQEV